MCLTLKSRCIFISSWELLHLLYRKQDMRRTARVHATFSVCVAKFFVYILLPFSFFSHSLPSFIRRILCKCTSYAFKHSPVLVRWVRRERTRARGKGRECKQLNNISCLLWYSERALRMVVAWHKPDEDMVWAINFLRSLVGSWHRIHACELCMCDDSWKSQQKCFDIKIQLIFAVRSDFF